MRPNGKKNRNTKTARKLYMLIVVGFLFLAIPIISVVMDPVYVIAKYITRIDVGTKLYNALQLEQPGALVHVYIFNITNADSFHSGNDQKLKLEEVGPFTYQEYRKNKDFELDGEEGVMRYKPLMSAKFVPELSIGDPKLFNVTVANTAFLALASMLATYPFWTKTAFNMLVNHVKSSPIINVDVQRHLWGYEEPLIALGNTLMPGWITFSKIGFLDRLYDQTASPIIEAGATDADKFRIKTVNGSPGLKVWGYDNLTERSRCNTLVDTYEGIFYPPGITTETPLRMYRSVFCRMLDLDLAGTTSMEYGSQAFVYRISNNTFKIDPKNKCGNANCKEGVTDISPCLYNLHMALSNAHFLHADPELYERLDGIRPNEEKHDTEILIDPIFGLVLRTSLNFQLSVDVTDVSFNSAAKPYSNMLMPLAYFKIVQEDIPEELKQTLRFVYYKVTYIIHGLELTIFIIGLLILGYTARFVSCSILCSKKPISYYMSKNEGISKIIQAEKLLRN